MNMIYISLLLLLLFPTIVLNTQYTPLLAQPPGITKGQVTAKLQIQIIYDPVCDDSSAFDQQWRRVQQQIFSNPDLKNKVKLRYIPLALPYHITAQKIVQALVYINQKNPNQALQTLRFFLQNFSQYNDGACINISSDQAIDKIASAISTKFGYLKTDLIKVMQHYGDYDYKARTWAKYVFGTMSVSGTPSLFINWIPVDGGSSKSSSEWINLLKNLLNVKRLLTE